MKLKEKPNFLFFMTDHQRYDTVVPFKRAITPNIDAFFENAMCFLNAYCPSPHCCPSRATFFSGLYPSEHGVWNNVNVSNCLSRGPYDNIRLWSEDLKEDGYKMYFSGKWHISNELGPSAYGFEKVFDFSTYTGRQREHQLSNSNEWDFYVDYEKMCNVIERGINIKGRNTQNIRQKSQLTRSGYPTYTFYGSLDNPFGDEAVVNEGLKYLEQCINGEEPWCLFIGPSGPHDPYYVPKRFLDLYDDISVQLPKNFEDTMENSPGLYRKIKQRFSQMGKDEHLECLKHYLAFCSYEDYLFGQCYDKINKSSKSENTYIVYLSDHGDYAGEHGLWAKGLPCYDGAYHIPLIIGGHKDISASKSVYDGFVSLADLAPTILDLAQIKYEKNRFSGTSLKPLLKNDSEYNEQKAVYTQTNGNELYGIQRSVRTKDWKYVYNGFDFDELYNLKDDPCEMINLADLDEYAQIQKELSKMLWKFAYERKDTCINSYVMVSLAKYGPGVAFGWE